MQPVHHSYEYLISTVAVELHEQEQQSSVNHLACSLAGCVHCPVDLTCHSGPCSLLCECDAEAVVWESVPVILRGLSFQPKTDTRYSIVRISFLKLKTPPGTKREVEPVESGLMFHGWMPRTISYGGTAYRSTTVMLYNRIYLSFVECA